MIRIKGEEFQDTSTMCLIYQAETEMLRARLKLMEEYVIALEKVIPSKVYKGLTRGFRLSSQDQAKGSKSKGVKA